MGWVYVYLALVVALLVHALAAVVLGRNLTRSVIASVGALAMTCFVTAWGGAGFVSWGFGILALLGLASIELIGWMLVDVDRDHVPPTDRVTWLARSLAFVLLGVLLGWLAYGLVPELASPGALPAPEAGVLGATFFGRVRELSWLLGFGLAGGLLATLSLLRDEEGEP